MNRLSLISSWLVGDDDDCLMDNLGADLDLDNDDDAGPDADVGEERKNGKPSSSSPAASQRGASILLTDGASRQKYEGDDAIA